MATLCSTALLHSTAPTGNVLKAPGLGTPCYKGKINYCWFAMATISNVEQEIQALQYLSSKEEGCSNKRARLRPFLAASICMLEF